MTPLRLVVLLLASLLAPAALAASNAESEAGDVSEVDKDAVGPLRDRVPPVSGSLFLKKGRFEISPGLTLSVKDAFYTKYVIGASLTYFLGETLGIGARFGYSLAGVSGAAQICTNSNTGVRGCNQPTFQKLREYSAPGEIQMLGGLDLQWSPIYGKISLSAERFVHFDMYGLLGGTFVQYGRWKNGSTPNSGRAESAMTGGANLGLGIRFVGTRWVAVRMELRDLIYSETGTGLNVSTDKSSLRQQIVVDFGLSFFFPTTFAEG